MYAKKVMIVEDETLQAYDMKQQLEGLGYRVTAVVPSSEKCMKKIDENLPDLVLMDIRIKGNMDGIDTAQLIKKQHEIPVVYLTTHAEEASLKRAKITENFGYMVKPTQMKELRSTIEIALFKAKIDKESKKLIRDLKEALDQVKALNHTLEKKVKERTDELRRKNLQLYEINTALNVLLEKRMEDKQRLEQSMLENIQDLIQPLIEDIKKSGLSKIQKGYFETLESCLKEIVSPFSNNVDTHYRKLTPAEIRVASLIRQGRSTKDIVRLLNTTERAVKHHRHRIREKFGLIKEKVNLASFLADMRSI